MKTSLTKTEKYSYSIIVVAVLLVLSLLCSCSAKTTTKSDVKNDSISKTTETKKESINEVLKEVVKSDSSTVSKKESEFTSFLNELEFEPADPTKESSITENGKTTTLKNLKVKKRNVSSKSKESSIETAKLIKSKDIELKRKNRLIIDKDIEIQKLKKQLSNHSEREAFIPWWMWLLLFILICIGGRISWLYYKGINPFGFVNSLIKKICI